MKTSLSRSFASQPLVLVWGLASVLAPVVAGAAVVTFTNDTVIVDTSYDGQNIVVSGCTVTASGRHSFNSLQVTNGGVLTDGAQIN